MKINIPFIANLIIEKLYEKGFEAFVVGGCVRDSLLGIKPKDWDITTSAKPNQVIEIFKDKYNVVETGIKHGTVTLIDEYKNPYEITTYRIEGEYEKNRKPKSVEFTSSIKEDLKRRDFTINAMAYNYKEGLIDYFSGEEDLKNKIIKCVGNPSDRFEEDALRIMRAFRFRARYNDFILDENLLNAASDKAYLLKNISVERIREEINQIITTNPSILSLLKQKGILDYIIPELKIIYDCQQNNKYHIFDVWNHTIEAMKNSEPDLEIRLSLLLHDIGKPLCKVTDEKGIDSFYCHPKESKNIAGKLLKRLKYDNKTVEKVTNFIEYHDSDISSSRDIKRMLNKLGEKDFRKLLKVKYGDLSARNPEFAIEKIEKLKKVEDTLETILKEDECYSMSQLKVNGEDLKHIGIKEGKAIGHMLNVLLDMVIQDNSLNTKEKLLKIVRERSKCY